MDNIDDKLKELQEKLDEKVNELDGYTGRYDEPDTDDYDNYNNSPFEDLEEDISNISNEISELKYEKAKEEAFDDFNNNKSFYESGNIITDKQTAEDILNRDIYADSISRLIANKQTETPLTVGVFGEWGMGKSSFLDLLAIKLNSLHEKNSDTNSIYSKIHIIRFDASEYNEETKIWYSLLKELFREFEKEKPISGKFYFAFKKFKREFKGNILKYLINTAILLTAITIYQRGILNVIKSNIAISSLGILSMFLVFTNILVPLIRKQLEFIKPLSEKVDKFFDSIDYAKYLGARETIKADFRDVIDIWLKKEKRNNKNIFKNKIVVLVDELDRCSEKTITEFFNALQLILPIEGLVVVLSVNYETVCYSLANNNKHYFDSTITNDQKIKFGISYLDKYINIPFYLQSKIRYKNYLDALLGKEVKLNISENVIYDSAQEESAVSKEDNDIIKTTFTKEELVLIKESIEKINSLYTITPREIKKIINLLIISKDICFNINLRISSKFRFKKYITWFLFAYFNPDTANNIASKEYAEYFTIEKHYFNDDEKAKNYFDKFSEMKNLNFYDIKICNRISKYFVLDINQLKKFN
ncbi:hypothetical protein JW813_10410 [Clostridium botulinum]|uniref:KAP family P-loop NTPase fold protein n=1 Tax=Clostridium botulinum TaxID=1491 RepID=UPI00224809D9|nr:P-loop NTPase fold protein [Clostridium botulinum]UZP02135.1 hypothetical protein JW813_10410 [Clostridium botulinum]UZP05495.1 hypothetical protein JYA71_10680 [Clostridium botulinum]UZP08875.1 hypothetical protein JYA74_10405 [Clostridium botulinum]